MIRLDLDSENDALVAVLKRRLDTNHLRKRLTRERLSDARGARPPVPFWRMRRSDAARLAIRNILRFTLTLRRGRRNALRLTASSNTLSIPALPGPFEGFRILHISDMHLDSNADLSASLVGEVRAANYDLCIMTGDFRARTFGPIDSAMNELRKVMAVISTDVYAVLGNHDSLPMVPRMEAMGINVLLNESAVLRREAAKIFLAGVDDPHFFRADDLPKVCRGLPDDAVRILLAHSPELFEQAVGLGFDAYLCGHTHGGQICLPGRILMMRNARAPRAYCSGKWRHRGMPGYTSRGSGVSIVDARFNCPPEITVHTLTAKEAG